jgi:hypothetical protein
MQTMEELGSEEGAICRSSVGVVADHLRRRSVEE